MSSPPPYLPPVDASADRKRRRDEMVEIEEEGESPEISSPEAKRLLLDILDDDADAGDQDLASVMKSLEEEIALPSPPPQPQLLPLAAVDQPDLGFLFEASDDELGLPPQADERCEAPEPEVAEESAGFGQIWGFDDGDLCGYEGFEFGIRPEERAEADDGVVFDGGLFDYADVVPCGPSDFADLSWRPETLPAV
ncbi:unnamed protein product [Musa hybrid cultivar]